MVEAGPRRDEFMSVTASLADSSQSSSPLSRNTGGLIICAICVDFSQPPEPFRVTSTFSKDSDEIIIHRPENKKTNFFPQPVILTGRSSCVTTGSP